MTNENTTISQELTEEEMEEITKYIISESENIADTVLSAAVEKYGMGNTVSLGVSVDILVQATGRIACVLAKLTGQGDMILDRVTKSTKDYIDSFGQFVDEANVVSEEK